MQTRKPAVGSAPNALPLVRMNKNEAPQIAANNTKSKTHAGAAGEGGEDRGGAHSGLSLFEVQ